MAQIESQIEINNTVDKVWDVVSDLDNEPRFWKGTKSVRNISRHEHAIKREIIIAFRDQKCLQTVSLVPKERIKAVFTKGIIDGSKTMTITAKGEKTILNVVWNVKLTGMMGMFTGMVKKHIKNGTEQALQKIKEEIER